MVNNFPLGWLDSWSCILWNIVPVQLHLYFLFVTLSCTGSIVKHLFSPLHRHLLLESLQTAHIVHVNIQLTCRVEIRGCQVSHQFCRALKDVLPQWRLPLSWLGRSVLWAGLVPRQSPMLFWYQSNHFPLKPYWTIWKNLWPREYFRVSSEEKHHTSSHCLLLDDEIGIA